MQAKRNLRDVPNSKPNNQDSTRAMEWKVPQVSNFPQKQQNRICEKPTEHNK